MYGFMNDLDIYLFSRPLISVAAAISPCVRVVILIHSTFSVLHYTN